MPHCRIERDKARAAVIQRRLPVRGRIAVRAVGDVLGAGESSLLRHAHARQRKGLHVHDIAIDLVQMRGERVRGGAGICGRCVNTRRKFDDRGRASNGVTPRAKPEAADVHVALCEAVAGHQRVRRNASGCPRCPGSPRGGARRPVQRISATLRARPAAAFTLPTPVYRTSRPGAFEQAAGFLRQCHDDQRLRVVHVVGL